MINPKFHSDFPLVILDKGESWEGEDANIIYWSDIGSNKENVYLPLLVDEHGEQLKLEYIECIEKFSSKKVDGISIKDTLQQEEGFSFWWMTLISEKSPWKSKEIFLVFCAMLLTKIIPAYKGEEIILVSNNKKLCSWIKNLPELSNNNVTLLPGKRVKKNPYSYFKSIVPNTFLAFLFLLRQVLICRGQIFSKRKNHRIFQTKKNYTVIGYSLGVNVDEFSKGNIVSSYWGKLAEEIKSSSGVVNWLMWYIPSEDFPSFKSILLFRNKSKKQNNEAVTFFEEFFSIKVLIKSLSRYFKLRKSAPNFLSIIDGSHDVLYFLNDDWKCSTKGISAIDACIKYSLLEEAINSLKLMSVDTGKGVYLYENQAWERALTYLWKQKTDQELLGFQHVSGKFYDLRPFDGVADGSVYDESPLPSIVIVTGQAAAHDMIAFRYPSKRVVIAESLRNLYLKDLSEKRLPEQDIKLKKTRTLLVVTDYLNSISDHQLKVMADAWPVIDMQFERVIIKPHPNCAVDEILKKYDLGKELKISIEMRPLSELWSQADAVYVSNITGAALESAYMKLPTLVSFCSNSFNMSPLRGVDGVSFVATANDLKKSLQFLVCPNISNEHICLDNSLKKWRKILEL